MKWCACLSKCFVLTAAMCAALVSQPGAALGQSFHFEAKPKVFSSPHSYAAPDPAPRMLTPGELERLPARNGSTARPRSGFNVDPSYRGASRPRASNPRDYTRTASVESVPAGQPVDPFGEELPGPAAISGPYQGEMVDDGGFVDGEYMDGGFDDGWGDECCDDGCEDDCYCDPNSWCAQMFPCLHGFLHDCGFFSPDMCQNFNYFSGAQAFKGPVDRGVNGNFGFHKGFNWASPMWQRKALGVQLGAALLVSDFEGRSGPFEHRRTQFFMTSGVFHRATCNHGWQGGAVFDYLHDDFYVNMDLWQVRSELSYVTMCGHEVGFWSAAHTKSGTDLTPQSFQQRFGQQTVTWQANDQYNLFYRYNYGNGGSARMWFGLTSHGDWMWGSDGLAPLSERWALQASYNYLWPRNDSTTPNSVKESFNLSFALVWFPGYKSPNACFNPNRPLFNVADNGTFMLTEKPR